MPTDPRAGAELWRALRALLLDVSPSIVSDIRVKAEGALRAAVAEAVEVALNDAANHLPVTHVSEGGHSDVERCQKALWRLARTQPPKEVEDGED